MTASKILYSLVARREVVLAEHSTISGNASLIAVRIIEKLPTEDTRVSYTQERHMFHVLIHDGMTFLCMAEESLGRRIPFAFLEDIRDKFFANHAHICKEAVAYELNMEFSRVLAQRMEFFSSDNKADAISRVRGEISEVKNIMIENIEKVLDRGETLDLLVDKTEHLQGEAFAFKREARRVRRAMWWKNMRMWFIIGGLVAFVVLFIVMLACGWKLNKC